MSGVTKYAIGTVDVRAGFPNGEKKCKWCEFCLTDQWMRKRERCILTYEILYDTDTIGARCPLAFTEEDNEQV